MRSLIAIAISCFALLPGACSSSSTNSGGGGGVGGTSQTGGKSGSDGGGSGGVGGTSGGVGGTSGGVGGTSGGVGGTSGGAGGTSGGSAGAAGGGGLPDASLTYAQEVLLDQPSLYWPTIDTNKVAKDASGNGHDGTGFNCVAQFNPTPAISAIELCNGYLDAGDNFDFVGTVPFTFEAWVRPSSQTKSYARIVSKENSSSPPGTPREGWTVLLDAADAGTGELQFERWATGTSSTLTLSNALTLLPTGKFTHLVATYDGSAMHLYLDGVVQPAKTSSLSLVNTAGTFRVGANADGFSQFMGYVDEVAVYSKALDAVRITAHHLQGVAAGL